MPFYSKSRGGFAADAGDSVEITSEYWQNLLAGQAAGKIIVANEEGYPVLQDIQYSVMSIYESKLSAIQSQAAYLQSQPFVYMGYRFYADQWATKTLESCLAVSLALGLADSDPVRVPFPLQSGYWLVADMDADNNRITVPFTVGDLKQAVTLLYDRNGAIWGRQMIHDATVESMVASGATAAQILAYDHTAGWDL